MTSTKLELLVVRVAKKPVVVTEAHVVVTRVSPVPWLRPTLALTSESLQVIHRRDDVKILRVERRISEVSVSSIRPGCQESPCVFLFQMTLFRPTVGQTASNLFRGTTSRQRARKRLFHMSHSRNSLEGGLYRGLLYGLLRGIPGV